jgi:hypothetical protein
MRAESVEIDVDKTRRIQQLSATLGEDLQGGTIVKTFARFGV